MHVPDRVLLQFGMLQHIPDPVEAVERVTMQGKADQDWSAYHDKYIKQWENRLSSVVKQVDTGNLDPTHARNRYLEWYWQITRRWISTPVEYPIISCQLSGRTEKVLVDLVSTVQGRIRALVSSEIDVKRLKESLLDIDMYITATMEKAKQVVQSDFPTGMGIGSIKSPVTYSNIVNPPQSTVAKMEEVSDDHVEGNTILQLDQMQRIQPASETRDLVFLMTGNSTNNQSEDVHLQEDLLDVTMTQVNLRDIISTPVEDAMNEIMNMATEDATADDITDSEAKNGYASIEAVEVQETIRPMGNGKVTAELQEFAGAPLINGQGTVCNPLGGPEFYKILCVSSHNEQPQKFTASENDDTLQEIVDRRTENSIGQGTMCQPFNAVEISKRRKSTIPSCDEVHSTIEATEMDGNAKSEERTCQTVLSGSDRLITFTRRKRKQLSSHPEP